MTDTAKQFIARFVKKQAELHSYQWCQLLQHRKKLTCVARNVVLVGLDGAVGTWCNPLRGCLQGKLLGFGW